MSFPSLLAAESRLAFHLCRPRHAAARRSLLSTTSCLARRSRPGSVPKEELQPHTQDVNKSGTTVEPLQLTGHAPTTTDLTATEKTKQALDNRRKVDVPMKVLPKAQLTLEHKLSPEQRLHIEHLTRHPPPQRPPKGRTRVLPTEQCTNHAQSTRKGCSYTTQDMLGSML